jgi:hypothetical protein
MHSVKHEILSFHFFPIFVFPFGIFLRSVGREGKMSLELAPFKSSPHTLSPKQKLIVANVSVP